MKLILASQSPRRQELLGRLTRDFSVVPSDADETLPPDIVPQAAVLLLARKKAAEVAARPPYQDCCIIGADTVVSIDGCILGKPADRPQAVEMLTLLSGRTHTVYTGMAVLTPQEERTWVTETQVTFYPLSPGEIAAYADSDEPYDKAGGYGIQSGGCILVKEISGDYYNAIGLPVAVLCRQLRALKILQTP